METRVQNVRHNPLLDRTEFRLSITHNGEATPSKEDVKERFSAEHDLDELEVLSVDTGYGDNVSEARIYVFDEIDLEAYGDKVEEEAVEQKEESKSGADADYDQIVDNTISDAKEQIQQLQNPDYEAAIEAEENNKNRKTFVEWLESQ